MVLRLSLRYAVHLGFALLLLYAAVALLGGA